MCYKMKCLFDEMLCFITVLVKVLKLIKETKGLKEEGEILNRINYFFKKSSCS